MIFFFCLILIFPSLQSLLCSFSSKETSTSRQSTRVAIPKDTGNIIRRLQMAEIQAYSIAELTRCKLLYESSIKDVDLRRVVAHVNLYDKVLDVLNTAEPRRRPPPPPIPAPKIQAQEQGNSGAEQEKLSVEQEEFVVDCVMAEKELGCGDHSYGSPQYNVVEVAEVEVSDDDD